MLTDCNVFQHPTTSRAPWRETCAGYLASLHAELVLRGISCMMVNWDQVRSDSQTARKEQEGKLQALKENEEFR